MKHNKLYILVAMIVLSSMILAACAAQATPTEVVTEAPATEAPVVPTTPPIVVPTAVPTEEPTAAPVFEGISLSAPDCSYGGEFKSIEAVDELTVKFTLCVPDPAFLQKVAFAVFPVYSSQYLEETGGGGQLLDVAVGTGPYMLSEWKKGDEMVFVQNPTYWGEPAKSPTLVFRWSSEAAQRLLELQSGTVDGIDNVGPADFDTVKNDPNLQMLERPALNIFYVGMNNTYPPFDNEQVRQAIAMGIDRQRLVDNFFPAGSEVATHFTPCAVPNACTGEDWYAFDPVKAKQMLADAGFANGFDTTITYRDVVRGYLPQPGVVAQDIQAQLKENLNITAEIVVMESAAFLDATAAGEVGGLHLLGWTGDYPDMTNFMDYHFGAGSSKQFGTHWDDITSNLTQAAQLANDAARAPFYEAANNAIRQHVPMLPISHGGSAVAYKATVQNPNVSALGNEYFPPMFIEGQDTFVWMQNAEPISLYCGDETDGESIRACLQVQEGLYRYKTGETTVEPMLATSCDPNTELTEWTCHLRENITFSNGDTLDANDVTETFIMMWDASNPLHVGRSGLFEYYNSLWGSFLNPPPPPTPEPTAQPTP
ncbi:MAG TPA: ABC transporter substrate-binding protein [Anaerolineales bacterium]|nr:ABC transporter substrate-binding protein [Anaerolineales bacterium]